MGHTCSDWLLLQSKSDDNSSGVLVWKQRVMIGTVWLGWITSTTILVPLASTRTWREAMCVLALIIPWTWPTPWLKQMRSPWSNSRPPISAVFITLSNTTEKENRRKEKNEGLDLDVNRYGNSLTVSAYQTLGASYITPNHHPSIVIKNRYVELSSSPFL